MDQDLTVNRLVHLGLNGYEARAYLALLGRESSTGADVARLSGVPRQRVYDILGGLVERGLASTRPGATVKYVATEPQLVIDQLVTAHRQRLDELEREARSMQAALSSLYEAGRGRTDPLEYIEVLRGRATIAARFDELQASVQREILAFTKPPYAIDPQNNATGLKLARTCDARSLYEFSLFDDLAATEGVRRFMQAGEQARVVPELPMKLVIMDEHVVMFGMQDPIPASSDLTIMFIQHQELARVLKAAFNAYWEQGLPFDQAYDQYMQAQGETT